MFWRFCSSARPDFIKPLNGYAGFAYNSTNVSIECWVECSPICNISWTRDGSPMDFDNTNLYYQTNVYHLPDQSKNDFESIQSTLVWNMTAWPDGHLHPFRDNENFTCESSGNGIGPGVKSETVFRVECTFEYIIVGSYDKARRSKVQQTRESSPFSSSSSSWVFVTFGTNNFPLQFHRRT